jgi:hypothetical protein
MRTFVLDFRRKIVSIYWLPYFGRKSGICETIAPITKTPHGSTIKSRIS